MTGVPDIRSDGVPGLIVAAPRSGAGKTTIALGLMRALTKSGTIVQPYKCGPDYIDPAHHAVAAGRPSYNLDTWAMHCDLIGGLVSTTAKGADIVIAEGVMGVFDGAARQGQSGNGSTADLAARLGWPVVLVLDVSGQTETAAAVALGCVRYRDDVAVAGVILNNVASARHAALITPAIERIGLPVLGTLARNEALALPERHLGLVQARDIDALEQHLDKLAAAVGSGVDLDAVRRVAGPYAVKVQAGPAGAPRIAPPGQTIAIAQDRAFSFMYPHLLLQWQRAGAQIAPFSPLADEAPDMDADAVWLPGGYPELHAGTITVAHRFKSALRTLSLNSVPIHGECGGYMVLGQGLVDGEGRRHEMCGLLSLETSFAQRKLHLGYRHATLRKRSALGPTGLELAGHEFHYATTMSVDEDPLLACRDASGAVGPEAGAVRGSVSGTFLHVIDRVGA